MQSLHILMCLVINYFANVRQTLKTTLHSAGDNLSAEHMHTHIHIEYVGVGLIQTDKHISLLSCSHYFEVGVEML